MQARKIARYGWKVSLPDHRDVKLTRVGALEAAVLPVSVDLSTSPFMPPVWNQLQLGACVAHGVGAAFEFEQRMHKPAWDFPPSRLFIYYQARAIEGTISQDSGAEVRDGIKGVNSVGVCKEEIWAYDPAKFAIDPPANAYTNAVGHKAVIYKSVPQDLNTMKSVLASGKPAVVGFTVYSDFESQEVADTGVLNMPTADESPIGGHCVLCVGYDDATQRFIIRNSWGCAATGSPWGINGSGYFSMPYAYLLSPNLAADFWMINLVTN